MRYKIAPGYERDSAWLLALKGTFAQSGIMMHQARNEIRRIKLLDASYVVKSFQIPHFLNKIFYTFMGKSKARRSYEYAVRLGAFTPPPIGYLETFRYALLDRSFYVCEDFHADFTIREPLLELHFPNREEILKALGHFIRALHREGFYHLDLSPGNILIKRKDEKFLFCVVDINRMAFKTLSLDEKAKNFSMLWADDRDLHAIVSAYLGEEHAQFETFFQKVLFYSHKHKRRKTLKKKFKQWINR